MTAVSPRPSQSLRATQRSPRFLLLFLLIAASLVALSAIPSVSALLGVGPRQMAAAIGCAGAFTVVANINYRVFGEAHLAYLLVALAESFALEGAFMWLIYVGTQPGHGASPLWVLYMAQAAINTRITEYRNALLLVFTLPPLLLAVAFVVLRGDVASALYTLLVVGLGTVVFLAGMRASLHLAAVVAERERLQERLAEVRVSDERSRIARDLHDGLGADLAAMAWRAQKLRAELRGRHDDELGALVERAAQGIDELRTVVWALRSRARSWDELVAYLRERTGELCEGRVRLVFSAEGAAPEAEAQGGLPGELAVELLRVVQEAVRNAVRHARAERIEVELRAGSFVGIRVEDDGVGVSEEAMAGSRGGIGNLRHRVQARGGTFEVMALAAPEHGTRIVIEVPWG